MINLVYCGNRLMFDGLLLSLLSVSKVTSSPLNVYLCTGDFTGINKTYLPLRETERVYLEGVIQKKNKESKLTLLDLTLLLRDGLLLDNCLLRVYPLYVLLRLFLGCLPEIPGRIVS